MKSILKIGDKQIVVNHPDNTNLTLNGSILQTEPTNRSWEHQVKEEFSKEGVQWGDAVKWVTSKMGIQQCAGCKSRQHILNQANQLGLKETIRQIKDTFSGSR